MEGKRRCEDDGEGQPAERRVCFSPHPPQARYISPEPASSQTDVPEDVAEDVAACPVEAGVCEAQVKQTSTSLVVQTHERREIYFKIDREEATLGEMIASLQCRGFLPASGGFKARLLEGTAYGAQLDAEYLVKTLPSGQLSALNRLCRTPPCWTKTMPLR